MVGLERGRCLSQPPGAFDMDPWRSGHRFGIGLRRPHFDAVLASSPDTDFFEILPENYVRFGGRPRRVLDSVRRRYPVLLHGVSLSIGGPDPLHLDYLAGVRALAAELEAPFFSDHLSYSSAFGVQYHDLLPLPFTEEAVRHVVARVDEAQHRLNLPLALENPSYYVHYPHAEMTEAEFITEVVRRSGCALLLDINNVYVNACNHGYDARAFIAALPLERVVQVHLAGHDASGPFIVDTHSTAVPGPVLDLYRETLPRLPVVPTLLEWDNDVPPLEDVIADLRRIKQAAGAARRPGGARGLGPGAPGLLWEVPSVGG